ncbi:MAG TPA: hypothetical protein VMR51_00700 [Patescibacteria group bacterium]|nr:hypothetical protein [Patescibacteria group bacterium]
MLFLSTKLADLPLLSIRNSGRIGTVLEPIINPHNLHIDGFYCQTPHSKDRVVLLDIDIREFTPAGIIIDGHTSLSEPDDLIRLKPVLDINFQLVDKPVLAGKKRIGKVAEYAIDKEGLFIQKLYVQPPVWQSINQNRLTIDRTSVIEVTDNHIVISGPEVKDTSKKTAAVPKLSTNYSTSSSLIKE